MSVWILLLGLAVGGLGEVPALSDAQRAQLATAEDGPRLDEGAWYPLIENALAWQTAAQEPSGGLLPGGLPGAGADYTALLAEPGAHRGELVVIEGRFAGRARRYGLSRRGLWGDALTEWVLVVAEPSTADPEQVAVVYFVDPEGTLAAPQPGQRVRAAARFYKVWHDTDLHGQPARYLTFVGRAPAILPAADGSADVGGSQRMRLLLGLGIPLALAVVWLVWRGTRLALAPRPLASQERRRDEAVEALRRGSQATEAGAVRTDAEPPLPTDPAAALAELERRARQQRVVGEGTGPSG